MCNSCDFSDISLRVFFDDWLGGDWVKQGCRVSYITGPSKWDWLTAGQILLFLQQVMVEGECFYISFVSSLAFIFLFLSWPSLSWPLYYLFCFSSSFILGDDTKWPTRIDLSLNSITNKNWWLIRPVLSQNYLLYWKFWRKFFGMYCTGFGLNFRCYSAFSHLCRCSLLRNHFSFPDETVSVCWGMGYFEVLEGCL